MAKQESLSNEQPNKAIASPFQFGKGLPSAEEMTKRMMNDGFWSSFGFEEGKPVEGFEFFDFPKVDFLEDKSKITIFADIPGVEAADIKISVSSTEILISGTRSRSKDLNINSGIIFERQDGVFERKIPLFGSVDIKNISTYIKNGVLQLIIPKSKK